VTNCAFVAGRQTGRTGNCRSLRLRPFPVPQNNDRSAAAAQFIYRQCCGSTIRCRAVMRRATTTTRHNDRRRRPVHSATESCDANTIASSEAEVPPGEQLMSGI